MIEPTQREKLRAEEKGLLSILEEHLYEIELINADLANVRKLLLDFDNGLDDNPWETYKVSANIDQDNVQ